MLFYVDRFWDNVQVALSDRSSPTSVTVLSVAIVDQRRNFTPFQR